MPITMIPPAEVDSYSSTMTGNETFADPGPSHGVYFLDPNGSDRNFNPSGDFLSGYIAFVKNIGTVGNVIFDSESSVQIIYPGQLGVIMYDGTTWR